MVFDNHTHTTISNLRLLDCINDPIQLIDKAIELGLAGIAITDHEALCAHMDVNEYAKKLQETHPEFTVALGDEIYLTDTRDKGQKYYHFILIAKDAIGHRCLRELSTKAWLNSYYDRGMERVPLLKEELKSIYSRFRGHLIATTACLGGELGTSVLNLIDCENALDTTNAQRYHNQIVVFLEYCLDLFGDDFYIEVAPAKSKDQIAANKRFVKIAEAFGIKMCVGSDSHYLRKEDRYVHKAYLTSKPGEREVDSFYEYCYLMDEQEIRENLRAGLPDEVIDQIFHNSMEIAKKIEFYDLSHSQQVTEVPVKDYPKNSRMAAEVKEYPTLAQMFVSNNIQERYWVNQCFEGLEQKIGEWDKHLNYVVRLEEEADTKRIIGEKLNTNMFAYPITLQHYIDLFWKCGSLVGPGRGSSCSGLNHYLLNVTQLDPIKYDLPWFRYLNRERVELGDIDLDLAPSRRPSILSEIKSERAQYLKADLDPQFKANLGCTMIATFGTETTKSAILTACRGYRSKDYPSGIDVDDAQYMTGLIPIERGFLWPLQDVIHGNPEKERKPVKPFLSFVNQFPGLLDIMLNIEGLVNKRSSHASGVILFSDDPFEHCCFMKTPKGEIITQWDLHKLEAAGNVKYDFLVVEVLDKIIQAIQLLQDDGEIDPSLSLREVYNKYFHPDVFPMDDKDMWKALQDGDVLNAFQFDSEVGGRAMKKIAPKSLQELADANGLMRLMPSEKGAEMPLDKYVRFKDNIRLWYKEMDDAGLSKTEQKILEPYFLSSYGVPPSQEQLMRMLMDPNICGFSLAEANTARKIVGKKQMAKIPALHEKVLKSARSQLLGQYVWKNGIGPQMGYSFSLIHALAYSILGLQTGYIATHWNPVYWNTACLIVNSGSLEDASKSEIVDIYAPEADDLANGVTFEDLPDRSGKVRKTASTDYSKVAKAIGEIRDSGVEVSLLDINKSGFGFKPDAANNRILYGLKGAANISDDFIKQIIANRPYVSMYDFYARVHPKAQQMVSLIKGGAFDSLEPRYQAMVEYVWLKCDKKKRITLQNLPGLIRYGLLPEDTAERIEARKFYEFTRYLKAECKYLPDPSMYLANDIVIEFLNAHDLSDLLIVNTESRRAFIDAKMWDKVYQKQMDVFRDWIASDKEGILSALNDTIFMEEWEKYGKGNLSSWEMDALCFYYHPHELIDANTRKYGISNYKDLPEVPVVERIYQRGNASIPIYRLNKICGTCIAKDKAKSTVYLLTTQGVVTVKFTKEYFSMFDRRISTIDPTTGKKKFLENSWFNRGSMIMVKGFRREDMFVSRNYAASAGHQLYRITQVFPNGDLELQGERIKGEAEEDDEV